MKNFTFTILAFIMLFTACKKDDKNMNKDKKLSSLVYKDNDANVVINYKYDTQGRLIEIAQDNPYLVLFKISYEGNNRVERILMSIDGVQFRDFHFTYAENEPLPNKITYGGGQTSSTSAVQWINNSLNYKSAGGRVMSLSGVDIEKRTLKSLKEDNNTYQYYFDNSLKNGLEDQSIINIPMAMIGGINIYTQLFQLNSHVLTSFEISEGVQVNFSFEKDASGYITKNGKMEYRYQ